VSTSETGVKALAVVDGIYSSIYR